MLKQSVLCAAILTSVGLSTASAIEVPHLRYVDRYALPYSPGLNSTIALNTLFGGISGIDRAADGSFYAISDDRSQNAPPGGNVAARFYNLSIAVSNSGFVGPNPITINSVAQMKRPNGTTHPALSVDPESIRLSPSGNSLYWTSEGSVSNASNPPLQDSVIREMDLSGNFIREFAVPAKLVPNATGAAQTTGIRNNLGYEALAISPDGTRAYGGNESSLFQDGPRASATLRSTNRIVEFDTATGNPTREFVYVTDPILSANPANAGDNGLTELLPLTATTFLAVERSFSLNEGTHIRVFKIDITGATDVTALNSLVGQTYTPVSKTLLLSLPQFALGGTFNADNIEGLAFGPVLPNGDQSFILVADNNFSAIQSNLFILIAIPEPAAASLLLPTAALLLSRRRA